MGTNFSVRLENGERLATSRNWIQLDDLPALTKAIPLFRWLDPFGLTIFNKPQRAELRAELERLETVDDDSGLITELLQFCALADERSHRYLWFVGD